MPDLRYVKPERIWLRQHPDLTERWLQERIAEDPSILGLGDLDLKDKERAQPRAGRLDLLLQDADANRRYEVEVQLGRSDEAHIIRTIEYWDIERKRYPQYEHVAVIVAEDITSRFLNVIGLFNGFIPLVAVQLNAVKIGDQITLVCSKVLDETRLGLADEDEEVQAATNRAYWEERSSRESLAMADELLCLVKEVDPTLDLKYNKHYIGLARHDQPVNFAIFQPKRGWLRLGIDLERSEETQARLDDSGLDVMGYDARWGKYKVRLRREDVEKHRALLGDLLRQSATAWGIAPAV